MKQKVLIVEDSLFSQANLKKIMEGSGKYEVVAVAPDGQSAKQLFDEHLPQIVTLDNILPDFLGMKLIAYFKKNPGTKVVMVSAVQQQAAQDEAFEKGADAYLCKPFSEEELLETLSKLR